MIDAEDKDDFPVAQMVSYKWETQVIYNFNTRMVHITLFSTW